MRERFTTIKYQRTTGVYGRNVERKKVHKKICVMKKIYDYIKAYFILILANPKAWGICLAFFLVYIYYEKGEVKEQEIQQYVQNSDTIILNNFRFVDYNRNKTYMHSFFRKKHANGARGSGTGFRNKEYLVVEDLDRKKYFELDYYDGVRFFRFNSGKNLPDQFFVVVNKKDLNNPKLGTHKKPIHILLFYTDERYKNYYITKDQYLINVKEYFSYDH